MGDLSAQLSFDNFAEPQTPTDRYFFALYPPPSVAAKVGQIAREQRDRNELEGRPLPTERFHVTLLHLGDYPAERPDVVSIGCAAAEQFRADAFEVSFDRVASFTRKGGNAPLVLQGKAGVQDLITFQRALANALKRTPLHRMAAGSFTPHMTLLYDDRIVTEATVDAVGWEVQEFVLVRSLLRKTQHIVLGRWALGTPP